MWHGSVVTSYIFYIIYTYYTNIHLYIYTCIYIHHVPKCMSCHKAIVLITGRAHCFHDYMYITPILLLWDLSTLYVMNHLYIYIYNSLKKLKLIWQLLCLYVIMIINDQWQFIQIFCHDDYAKMSRWCKRRKRRKIYAYLNTSIFLLSRSETK